MKTTLLLGLMVSTQAFSSSYKECSADKSWLLKRQNEVKRIAHQDQKDRKNIYKKNPYLGTTSKQMTVIAEKESVRFLEKVA